MRRVYRRHIGPHNARAYERAQFCVQKRVLLLERVGKYIKVIRNLKYYTHNKVTFYNLKLMSKSLLNMS